MNCTFKVYDVVALLADTEIFDTLSMETKTYKKGTIGTIVMVLDEVKGVFIVELFDENNETIGVGDVNSSRLELRWSYTE